MIGMTNYITMTDMIDITGVEPDIVSNFDDYITKAQTEFELRVRTFTGEENDYDIAKRAVAFLTEYYIRRYKKEIEYAKVALEEYLRLVKELNADITPETENYFDPNYVSITQDDLDD